MHSQCILYCAREWLLSVLAALNGAYEFQADACPVRERNSPMGADICAKPAMPAGLCVPQCRVTFIVRNKECDRADRNAVQTARAFRRKSGTGQSARRTWSYTCPCGRTGCRVSHVIHVRFESPPTTELQMR